MTKKLGEGTYGTIYAYPRYKYKVHKKYKLMYNSNNNILNINNNKNTFNEVSKIFKQDIYYYTELKKYKNILKYKLSDKFFNFPINYGNVNIDKKNVYQITFKLGKNILDNNFNEILLKFKNILYGTYFLNINNLIFDDYKISNMIEINGIIKFSDYSTITSCNNIINNYEYTYLKYYYYFIYCPYLNILLDYYINNYNIINKNNKVDINDLDIINKIKLSKKIRNNNNSLKKTIKEIKNYIILNKKNISKDIYEKIKLYKFDLFDIDKYIYLDDLNTIKYCKILYKYLNNKYVSVKDRINDLIKRINIYSLGISLLYILNHYILKNKINLNINIIIEIYLLIVNCCINCIKYDSKYKIYEYSIKNIIYMYSNILNKYIK